MTKKELRTQYHSMTGKQPYASDDVNDYAEWLEDQLLKVNVVFKIEGSQLLTILKNQSNPTDTVLEVQSGKIGSKSTKM
jgi:hypothetical protein